MSTTPARERSPFGQFQLNRSGIDVGVDFTKVQHSSTADMAQMLRDGFTLEEVAEVFDMVAGSVRSRLNIAGWCSTGEAKNTPDEPEPSPRTKHHTTHEGGTGAYLLLFSEQPWAVEALCAQTDPESFFPEKGGSTRDAKATCAQCWVQAECLDYALTTNERYGVWGGFSERERRALLNPTSPAYERTAS